MKSWILKLHLYLGLYFLIFLWLFSVSGLLLNHQFKFAEFYPQRRETKGERPITPPPPGSDFARAMDLARQLGVEGELEWTANRPTAERLDFRISRPGHLVDVKADLLKHTAAVQDVRYNGWGVLRALHTFNGVGFFAPQATREWSLTKLWTFAMDAVAAGVIVLVASSVILAWLRRDKRIASIIAFAAGCLACGLFVLGLRFL
jgi:hypothetical protein